MVTKNEKNKPIKKFLLALPSKLCFKSCFFENYGQFGFSSFVFYKSNLLFV